MKRDLFLEYGEFVFGVLSEIMKRVDLTASTIIQKRAPAYCSEFLTSMFISSLIKKGYKVKTCKVAVLLITKKVNSLLDVILFTELKRKYFKYKILSELTFGKTRKKYRQKKQELKERIKTVKS